MPLPCLDGAEISLKNAKSVGRSKSINQSTHLKIAIMMYSYYSVVKIFLYVALIFSSSFYVRTKRALLLYIRTKSSLIINFLFRLSRGHSWSHYIGPLWPLLEVILYLRPFELCLSCIIFVRNECISLSYPTANKLDLLRSPYDVGVGGSRISQTCGMFLCHSRIRRCDTDIGQGPYLHHILRTR